MGSLESSLHVFDYSAFDVVEGLVDRVVLHFVFFISAGGYVKGEV
jgi:hypothetical protein